MAVHAGEIAKLAHVNLKNFGACTTEPDQFFAQFVRETVHPKFNSSFCRHSICCLLLSSRCNPAPWFPSDGATKYANSRTVSPRLVECRQSDRQTQRTRDRAIFCRGCRSCRKRRNACRVPSDDCHHPKPP